MGYAVEIMMRGDGGGEADWGHRYILQNYSNVRTLLWQKKQRDE